MKWTQGRCGFSYDDNWCINIGKNDEWEAFISILVEKKIKKEHVGEGKRKEKKIGVVALSTKVELLPSRLQIQNPTHWTNLHLP